MAKEPTSDNVGRDHNSRSSETAVVADQLEGTPFTIVNYPEKGWMLALGNQLLTDPTATVEETINKLETEKWYIVMRVATVMHQRIAQEAVKSMEEAMLEQEKQKTQLKMDL